MDEDEGRQTWGTVSARIVYDADDGSIEMYVPNVFPTCAVVL
jgi:hypothetical protein